MLIPKKSLGQNFLKDKNIVDKIVNSVDIYNNNIIEIGPGFGALTKSILNKKPKKLIIIEKDISLYNKLLLDLKDKNVSIINEDAMHFDYQQLKNFTLISNLPYNISSKFLLKVIKHNNSLNEIYCMIQKELAIKFDYNSKKMNKYKFLSQFCGKFQILFNVSPNVFYPKPKVDSSVVKFTLKKQKINQEKLDTFTNNFFLNKRKKIRLNKILNNIIVNKELSNKRYEDLDYKDILSFYERFNLPFS